jgi:hypothetical protein
MAKELSFLGITWLKNNSMSNLDNLHDPDKLALKIMENL